MRNLAIAGAVAVVAALTFLLGVLYAGGFDRDRDPPCEEAESPTPEGEGCVPSAEVCNAYGRVVKEETVSCTVRSDDGRGLVRTSLAGIGRVDVKVYDGTGALVHSRSHSLAAGSPADVPVQGKPETWRLEVRFVDVSGDVRVLLWG